MLLCSLQALDSLGTKCRLRDASGPWLLPLVISGDLCCCCFLWWLFSDAPKRLFACPQNRNKVDHSPSFHFNNQIFLIDRVFLGFISWPILRSHLEHIAAYSLRWSSWAKSLKMSHLELRVPVSGAKQWGVRRLVALGKPLPQLECALPSSPMRSPISSASQTSDSVEGSKAILLLRMIGESRSFVRRERLIWRPQCPYAARHQERFSLLVKIQVGFQVTGGILFRNCPSRHVAHAFNPARGGWGIAISSRPVRSTHWVLGQPVLHSETLPDSKESPQTVRQPSQFHACRVTLRPWVWYLALTLQKPWVGGLLLP